VSDGFGLTDAGKPDYDSAAQAAMVMAATLLGMEFRDKVIALAEKYAADSNREAPNSTTEAGR
jgi:hypothetical protein